MIRAEQGPSKYHTPLIHPLGGSDLRTLLRVMGRYRPFSGSSRRVRLTALAAVLLRLPFYSWERARHGRAIQETALDRGPVFIIGHWRSGTTHLHNILSRDPQFAWITFLQTSMPWDFLGKLKIAPPIIERYLPKTRGMDNVRLTLDSPQEEEMALGNMGDLCYYYCYYFPRYHQEIYRRSILLEGLSARELEEFAATYRYLAKKLAYRPENRGKRLLFKNPASTARAPFLRSLFPHAKFVHIVRNPFEVFCSTHRHFQRIMPAFAWQEWEQIDFQKITLQSYAIMMQKYLEIRKTLPAQCLLEVRFEELERDPLAVIERIYEHLGIDQGETGMGRIGAYLKGQEGYRKNRYTLARSQIDSIRRSWAFALEEWGYDRPPEVGVV